MAGLGPGEGENSTPSHPKVLPPRLRSYSSGAYGKPPQRPQIITIQAGSIKHKEAKKTLLAIIRLHWPVGAYTYREIERITNKRYTEEVLDEFHRYYAYEPSVSHKVAISCVRKHIMGVVRRTINEEKTRAYARAKASGGSPFDHRPAYFSLDVWRYFCDHWVSDAHIAKSETSKKNREKLEVNHTAGAKPFDDVREELERSNGTPPSLLKLWEATHKKKDTGDWVTKAAQEIYALAVERSCKEPPCTPADEPLDLWLQATGGAKKNRIIGMPRVLASSVLSPARRSSHGGEVGLSKSGRGLRNEIFVQIVEATLARARASSLYQGPKLNSQTLKTLAQEALAAGDMGPDSGLSELIRGEALRLAVSLFENILLGIEHMKEGGKIAEKVHNLKDDSDELTLDGFQYSDNKDTNIELSTDDEAEKDNAD